MATRDVKARVALEGEQQYKAALSELTKGNQVLNSEMKKLQAEYKGNAQSTEFLTKKGEILERQLLQQRDKVEVLRKAVAESAQQFGEADKRTQDYIIKLNNAEAAEFNLQHAIDENSQALQNNGQQMVSLGDVADQLAGKIGIRIPEDLSLLGFDNIRDSALPRIGLTTIDQPKPLMASMAVSSLLEKIGNERSGYAHRVLAPTLIPRTTCAHLS